MSSDDRKVQPATLGDRQIRRYLKSILVSTCFNPLCRDIGPFKSTFPDPPFHCPECGSALFYERLNPETAKKFQEDEASRRARKLETKRQKLLEQKSCN